MSNPTTETHKSHLLSYLNKDGDTKHIWDANNSDEVEVARKIFNELTKKGFQAFSVEGKEGTKGKLLKEFDPEAERIILSPRIVGG